MAILDLARALSSAASCSDSALVQASAPCHVNHCTAAALALATLALAALALAFTTTTFTTSAPRSQPRSRWQYLVGT